MPLGLFQKRRSNAAETVYRAIAEQARRPALYLEFAVPDTVDGRFDMIVLHAVLFFRRLRTESDTARALGQEVFDLMFREMDGALRELGVGDLSVPKKVRAMGEAFYGRATAYDAALGDTGDGPLAAALARNVFAEDPQAEARAVPLAAYVRRAARALAEQDVRTLVTAGPDFPQPAQAAEEGLR